MPDRPESNDDSNLPPAIIHSDNLDLPEARVANAPPRPVLPLDPNDPEDKWIAEVYQPDAPNLTARAVVAGAVIGAVMCLSNLYVFFKTGWSQGVTITACILGFSTFAALRATGVTRTPLGVLENNSLTTVASGAGYMTGGGNMAAFGALLMLTAVRPDTVPTIAWFAVIAALGVFVAIPIKRQLINREGLSFPTGTATAETLRSIHSGASSSRIQATVLGTAAAFAALVAVARDVLKVLPGTLSLPISLAGHELAKWTLALKTEVILIGAGGLMSLRTCWSMLLGGVLTYGVMAPELVERGYVADVSYKAIVAWTLWPGAAMLVGAGLTTFALDFRSLGRAFAGIAQIFGGRRELGPRSAISSVESPDWWVPAGVLALSPIVVLLMFFLFQIPLWAAAVALPLAVVMGFIAARVTGETDVTPTKALGPVTQMIYGVLTPGNLTGNIMSANVTGGVGLHAADLLTTLKTGWLLGAKPRHQLYAQLIGVVVGAAVVVPAFLVIIPDPKVLGSEEWPAPSCVVWAGVSKAFSNGIGGLDGAARTAIVIGLLLGVTLTLLERFAPRRARSYLPSPNGLGLSMVIPGSNAVAMFVGGLIADLIRRRNPAMADRVVVPAASGLIAGESLAGIVIAVLVVLGYLQR
jgi:putative OPT family oligopeptide transporter